mmetsp:Transcript_8600/g.12745  ORF Transcript_8600/g.12745 Transcript_8600/m.12745 type:complete len:463 (+) Transcript_8600:1407-2795(+)
MEEVLSHPVISNYLSYFPTDQRSSAAIATFLIGINSLQGVETNIDAIWNLAKKPPKIQQQLNSMKEELRKLTCFMHSNTQTTPAQRKPPLQRQTVKHRVEETPRFRDARATPSPKGQRKHKHPNRSASTPKNPPTMKQPPLKIQSRSPVSKQTPRKIPVYLKKVDSKIKQEVHKDRNQFKVLMAMNKQPEIPISHSSEEKAFAETEKHYEPQDFVSSTQDSSKANLKNSAIQTEEPEESLESRSQNLFESSSILLEESKANSLYTKMIPLDNSLEGTFTKLESQSLENTGTSIPYDRDFETPRYPSETKRSKSEATQDENELMEIADKFLHGPIMRQFSKGEELTIITEESPEDCTRSMPVPPLELFSSADSYKPFRIRWEEATKNICKNSCLGSENSTPDPSLDFHQLHKKSQEMFLSEFYRKRPEGSSSPMLLETPSPTPFSYDEKLIPMSQDALYAKFI